MRLGIFSDIHGNWVALQAVLAGLEQQGADQIVCLGDAVGTGPQPHETLQRLKELSCPVVMGNADAWVLHPQPFNAADDQESKIAEIDLWCASQLTPDDWEYLRGFQPTITISLGQDARLLCFHGSPRSNTEIITAATPDGELGQMLAGQNALVMAGGHTHIQMLRRYRSSLLINAGSVGLPYEYASSGDEAYNPAFAEYALVSWDAGKLGIELRRAPVDVDAVVQAALASGMPHAGWWSGDWKPTRL